MTTDVVAPTNIENWPIEKLIDYARNPRKNDHAVDQIAAAIKEFGFRVPIIAKSDGTVVDGHLRLKAAKKLSMPSVPVILADDMTETQIKAFRISVNRMAELADWDMDLLKLELIELADLDFDLDLTGFGDDFLKGLTDNHGGTEGNTDPDDVPENVETRCKPGDLWILGEHRLLCGDSTNVQHVEKLMNGEKADMVFTDPPYGIGIDGQKASKAKNPKHNRKAHDFRGWDCARPDAGVFNYVVALKVPAVIFGGNYFADILPASRGWLYWGKGQDGALTASDGELAWTNLDKPLRAITVNRAALQGSVHPTQKFMEVIEFCFDYVGDSASVLDLFLGSGSTLIACEKTGRKCYGMEIDPHYCDVILKRWENFTGKQAVLSE